MKKIMARAWKFFRKGGLTFSEALHRSWNVTKAEPLNAETVRKAAQAAGVKEEVKTWSGWKDAGYEVAHGSKALFQCSLIYASKGDGKFYKGSFFGFSQVHPIGA